MQHRHLSNRVLHRAVPKILNRIIKASPAPNRTNPRLEKAKKAKL